MNDPHLLHHQITNQITESPILSPYLNQPDNIYPGKASANPNQTNPLSSELFIEKFSEVNHYAKQLNLEKYLNDEKHLYIKPKTLLSTALTIIGLIIYLWVYTEIDEAVLAIDIQKSTANELKKASHNKFLYSLGIFISNFLFLPRK